MPFLHNSVYAVASAKCFMNYSNGRPQVYAGTMVSLYFVTSGIGDTFVHYLCMTCKKTDMSNDQGCSFLPDSLQLVTSLRYGKNLVGVHYRHVLYVDLCECQFRAFVN